MSARNEPRKQHRRVPSGRAEVRTLGIDIGGTGLKASVLDSSGRMVVERVRVSTPDPCPPKTLLDALAELAASLPAFDRISVGFPGVVRDGRVITAPHFPTKPWRDYPLEFAIAERFDRPVRLLNDAEVQALGIVTGNGLEVVLTLGTGIGSAVLRDGWLAPHLELAQHPLLAGKTYKEYVGKEALNRHGSKKWNMRVLEMIGVVESLFHYDVLYLGGGNVHHLEVELPRNVRTASNDTGITGGIYLWDEGVWESIRGSHKCWTRPRAPTVTEPASKSSRPANTQH
ncbi:ROK family protein [Steroidobacter cummioxidans]|uniref:ROK family protein n=1 Tax=Steroidobacter cummioxidans TaxID=1803913 RepID=UPI000E31FB61|nr:ROK family protein [Steroidobacter cummioxidans]